MPTFAEDVMNTGNRISDFKKKFLKQAEIINSKILAWEASNKDQLWTIYSKAVSVLRASIKNYNKK